MRGKILRGAIILVAATGAGFAFGRYGLGESYLKQAVPSIKRPPRALQRPASPPEEIPEISPEIPPLPAGQRETAPSAEEQPQGEEGKPKEGTPRQATGEESYTERFSVQVGSFENEEAAAEQAESVSSLGYPARISPLTRGAEKVYRVMVGSYTNAESARRMAEELRQKGFDAFVSQE